MRQLAFRQMKRFIEWDLVNENDIMANPVTGLELPCILGAYDWSTSAKLFLHLQSAFLAAARRLKRHVGGVG